MDTISVSGVRKGARGHRQIVSQKSNDHLLTKDQLNEVSVQSLYEKFLDNTRISWILYVSSRRRIWRLIWIFVIVIAIIMALIQSWRAMVGYSGYDVSLQTTFRLNATLPFPAVTICSNSPINWQLEEQLNSSFFQEINTRLENEDEKSKYDSKFKKKGNPYEEYILFDVLRKYILPPTDYGVVSNILWNGTKYAVDGSDGSRFLDLEEKGIVKRAHDLYYGDCFTFNAGVDNETMIDASALTGIEFILDWEVKDRYPFLNDPAVILTVHQAGTAPVLGDGNSIKVYPKDEVTIGIKERLIERLSAPYPSHCVKNTEHAMRTNSVYYDNQRRYLYSIEACINTCIQRLSLEICNCWDYQIPLGLLKSVDVKYAYASVCASRCSKIDSVLNLKLCRCNLPCQEITMEVSTSVKSNLIEEILTNDASSQDFVNISNTKTRVKIFLKTSVYEFSSEVPKYTIADFWGIIGGNAAFWIGISAVSLFEIVEFAIHLMYYGLKTLCGYLKNYARLRKFDDKFVSNARNRRGSESTRVQRPNLYRKRPSYLFDTIPPFLVENDLSLKPYYRTEDYSYLQ